MSPADASTPAVITIVSLGTSGMIASRYATANRSGYVHQAPETRSISLLEHR